MALERTFSIIKPDAVAKNAIGQIVGRFEANGLQIIAQRMEHLTEEKAKAIASRKTPSRSRARNLSRRR